MFKPFFFAPLLLVSCAHRLDEGSDLANYNKYGNLECPIDTHEPAVGRQADWASGLGVDEDAGAFIKGHAMMGYASRELAIGLYENLSDVCQRLAVELGRSPGKTGQENCKIAIEAARKVRAQMGPGARIVLRGDPPECAALSRELLECANQCDMRKESRATALCQGSPFSGPCFGRVQVAGVIPVCSMACAIDAMAKARCRVAPSSLSVVGASDVASKLRFEAAVANNIDEVLRIAIGMKNLLVQFPLVDNSKHFPWSFNAPQLAHYKEDVRMRYRLINCSMPSRLNEAMAMELIPEIRELSASVLAALTASDEALPP